MMSKVTFIKAEHLVYNFYTFTKLHSNYKIQIINNSLDHGDG